MSDRETRVRGMASIGRVEEEGFMGGMEGQGGKRGRGSVTEDGVISRVKRRINKR